MTGENLMLTRSQAERSRLSSDRGTEATGPMFERLARSSQGRATALDLLAQAAGLVALAVATLGMWVLKIWG